MSLSQGPERILQKAWLMHSKDTTTSQGLVIKVQKMEHGFSIENMQVVWTSGANTKIAVILVISVSDSKAAICVTTLVEQMQGLQMQLQMATPTSLLNLCKGTVVYHRCGWIPVDQVIPWRDFKSRLKVQAVFAMAYVDKPHHVCDRQTLQRVQK